MIESTTLPPKSASDPSSVAIRMKGVSKSFSETGPVVLQDINLEVTQGDFLCILGASGCGKSTLLSMLAGLETPTAGAIETASKPALMFQEPALFPWLTASRNVELVMQLRGIDKEARKAKAAELLALVHLENALNLRPHELSGGMRQRVALARALAQEGSVLLMDEPFAALDAVTRDILHEELIRVWKETSSTIVFVTHNVREAVRLGQKVLLMSSRPGRIIKEWDVSVPEPRRIEDEYVSKLAGTITQELRSEISRHAK